MLKILYDLFRNNYEWKKHFTVFIGVVLFTVDFGEIKLFFTCTVCAVMAVRLVRICLVSDVMVFCGDAFFVCIPLPLICTFPEYTLVVWPDGDCVVDGLGTATSPKRGSIISWKLCVPELVEGVAALAPGFKIIG